MIYKIAEILATFTDIVFLVWFIPSFLHMSKKDDIKPLVYIIPVSMLAFEYLADYFFPGFDFIYLIGVVTFTVLFAIVINVGRKSKFRALLASCIYIVTQMFSSSLVYAVLSFVIDDIDSVMQGEASVPRVIYLSVCLAARVIIYKVILTIFSYNDPLDRKNGLFISFYTLASSVALGILMRFAVAHERENEVEILLLLVAIIILTVISYFMIYQVQVSQRREYEYKLIAERASYAKESANEASIIWENIRKVRHELKNHLSIVSAKLRTGDVKGCAEYVDHLTETVEHFGNIVKTDNAVIDYLINSKLPRQDKIKVIVSGYVGDYTDIDDTDLACILGNIIDNAVEAESNIEESKRRIELHFLNQNHNRIIICKNTINHSVLKTNPKLQTTKNDTAMHGLGHRIVQETAEKYYGFVNYSESDDMFCVQIILPQKQ